MSKLLASLGILAMMIALGVSDAVFVEGGLPEAMLADTSSSEPTVNERESSSEDGGGNPSSVEAVRKLSGRDVLQTLSDLGFEASDTSELSILRSVIPASEADVLTKALLKDGDRAGVIAWTESPQVKTYFLSLKEALHTSFSPRVEDLLDETQRIPGKPPRNFLTFIDPGLSPERMIFLRVRERLYELRIAEGNEEAMYQLVDALTE